MDSKQTAETPQTVEQFITACERRFAERESQPDSEEVRPGLAFARLVFTESRTATPPE